VNNDDDRLLRDSTTVRPMFFFKLDAYNITNRPGLDGDTFARAAQVGAAFL